MSRRVRRPLPLPAPNLPVDLAPLPAHLAHNAASDQPLDVELVRSALWHASGVVSNAARLLDVSPARMLNFVRRSPYLSAEREKAAEMVIDHAEATLLDALEDDETSLDTAKWILERKGAVRGWGSGVKQPLAGTNISFGKGDALVQIKWQDDSESSDVA